MRIFFSKDTRLYKSSSIFFKRVRREKSWSLLVSLRSHYPLRGKRARVWLLRDTGILPSFKIKDFNNPYLNIPFFSLRGGKGIRTHGTTRLYVDLANQCLQPLSHSST